MANTPLDSLTDTWNAGATTFTAIKMNVTDTASAAASLLQDLQVGGNSKFKVAKDGATTVSSTTLGTSTTSGALICSGSGAFNKKCFIMDGVRVEQTATTVYSDITPLSTGHVEISGTASGTSGVGRITSTIVNNTAVSARQIQGGLAFDGVTVGLDTHTIGAMGQSDYTWNFRISVGTDASGLFRIGAISYSGENIQAYVNAGSLGFNLNSGGVFVSASVASFVSNYGGKVVDVAFVRSGASGTAASYSIYINGILSTSGSSVSGVGANFAGSTTVTFGSFSGGLPYNGNIYSARIFNRALSASEVVALANVGVSQPDKWASVTGQTSGTLTIGQRYRITTFVAGDSFTNVGAASNATGVEFVATGTTPTTWTNSSTLTKIGCLLEPQLDIGVGYQAPDYSSNKYHGTISTTGASHVIAQRRGQIRYRFTFGGAGNSQLNSQQMLPSNAIITDMTTYSVSGTPTIKIGSASAGAQYVAAVLLSATSYKSHTLVQREVVSGGAVWMNSDGASTVDLCVTYMLADL